MNLLRFWDPLVKNEPQNLFFLFSLCKASADSKPNLSFFCSSTETPIISSFQLRPLFSYDKY